MADQAPLKRGGNSLQVETPQGVGAVITVNSTADIAVSVDNECTLREAIANANSGIDNSGGNCVAGTAGADDIIFSIPNGNNRATIVMTGMLPTITDPVTIDGNTQ